VRGAWCVVRGAWCVVRGAWCVVRGAWCVAATIKVLIRQQILLLYFKPIVHCVCVAKNSTRPLEEIRIGILAVVLRTMSARLAGDILTAAWELSIPRIVALRVELALPFSVQCLLVFRFALGTDRGLVLAENLDRVIENLHSALSLFNLERLCQRKPDFPVFCYNSNCTFHAHIN
jgi:hypothetical protein